MVGFFDSLKEGVNDFIFSLTTNDRYATSGSPFNPNQLNVGENVYRRNNSNANFISNSNNASNLSLDGANQNVGYRPGFKSRAHNDGDIQMADYGNSEPVAEIWERLEAFLANEYPELLDFINEPATAADLNELENDINVSLPSSVRESYQIHDGQERGGKPTGLIFGLTLLDIESIAEEYNVWQTAARKIEHERKLYIDRVNAYKQQMAQLASASSSSSSSESKASKLKHKKIQPPVPRIDFVAHQRSYPDGTIQPVYVHSGWVPLVKDFSGNNIAVDLAPGPKGKWGQIICFGQDFDTKFVIANSWNEFLEDVVKTYEGGNYILDDVEEELWYAENGRPLNYLDVLKKKFLGNLKPQRRPQIPRVPSGNQFPATKVGDSSPLASNVVLPKETLIEPTSQPKPEVALKTETEKVAGKAELTFDDNESILTNDDKDDEEPSDDKPLKKENQELKDIDF